MEVEPPATLAFLMDLSTKMHQLFHSILHPVILYAFSNSIYFHTKANK